MLMYPSLCTYLDISYTVATLGYHATNPGLKHLNALERVFCYLCTTTDYQLVFHYAATKDDTLFSYIDTN